MSARSGWSTWFLVFVFRCRLTVGLGTPRGLHLCYLCLLLFAFLRSRRFLFSCRLIRRWARAERSAVGTPEPPSLRSLLLSLITFSSTIFFLSSFPILCILLWSAWPTSPRWRPGRLSLVSSLSLGCRSLVVGWFTLLCRTWAAGDEPPTETPFVGSVAAAFYRNTARTRNIGRFRALFEIDPYFNRLGNFI